LCEPRDAPIEHSDKGKFRSDLNRPESCAMSERPLKTLEKSGDFQAEYEGSIPSPAPQFSTPRYDLYDLARF
jgi:hypothetical protein